METTWNPAGRANPAVVAALLRRYGVFYPTGKAIVREGEPTTELYVIVKGSVEFSIWDPAAATRQILRTSGPGEVFGEIACFCGGSRTATATATADSTVLRFDRPTAERLLRESPAFASGVIAALSERLREATKRTTAP